MLRLARKLDPFSTGLLAAALFVAVNEAIRAHWFTAFFTFAIALMAVICIKQVQRSLYFRQQPAEWAAWQAAPPPPPGSGAAVGCGCGSS